VSSWELSRGTSSAGLVRLCFCLPSIEIRTTVNELFSALCEFMLHCLFLYGRHSFSLIQAY